MVYTSFLVRRRCPTQKRQGKHQSRCISRPHTNDETVLADKENITTFCIDEDNDADDEFVYLLHENADDFAKPEYPDVDEIIAGMDEPALRTSHFELINIEEPIPAQPTDRSRA